MPAARTHCRAHERFPGKPCSPHYRHLIVELLEDRRLLSNAAGPALLLDGIDDYATAPDHASLDLGVGVTDDFTIEASFYVADLNGEGLETLIYKQGAYALFANFHTGQAEQFWSGQDSRRVRVQPRAIRGWT